MNYLSLTAQVLKLISSYGLAMTIRQAGAGAFDPTTGAAQGGSLDTPCLGLLSDYSLAMVDGTSVLSGDRRVYVAASGLPVTPKAGDQLLVGSEVFNLVKVDSLGPGGVNLLYDIQARS
jgi:hypothetical protein